MARLAYRRLRAPQGDGAALIHPAIADIESLLHSHRQRFEQAGCSWLGTSLADAARTARRELLAVARQHTAQYRDDSVTAEDQASQTFILSGHQPELFHPGVWFKNFLLSSLAARTRSVAVNLVIDTDAAHGASLRVPTIHDREVQIATIPFDAPTAACAWEDRPVVEAQLLASFPARVTAAYDSVERSDAPGALLIHRLWQYLPTPTRGSGMGTLLARARHRLEQDFGLRTLEAPMSRVAQTISFRRFVHFLLQELASYREIYNTALAEYRQVNGIRSRTHPVPALAVHDGWREAPLFMWTTAEPRRRALFARPRGNSLELTDREGLTLVLAASPEQAVEQWAAYETRGIKIRPRALLTTMYARLLLSDTFIHGIGGAKYDELTDVICERFLHIQLPAFVTATATFRLPLATPLVTADQVRASARRLRDLRFRPESFVADPLTAQRAGLRAALRELALEKRDYLRAHQLKRGSRGDYEGLHRLNRAMYHMLAPIEASLRAEYTRRIAQAEETRLLSSREFSFVLYDSEILPARLLDLCKVSS